MRDERRSRGVRSFMESKLSEQLAQHLQSTGTSELLDVIIELHQKKEAEATPSQSRTERIANLKETFSRKIAPLEETIRQIGGEVTGQAWINQTLRVRVPADKVKLLSAYDQIAKLDLPHLLKRDG